MRHIVTMIVDTSPERAEAIRSHMHAAKLEVTYFNGSRNETRVFRPRRLTVAREPISSLTAGTFVEVTRINVGDDETPAYLKGRWRGMVPVRLGREMMLLDLDEVDRASEDRRPWHAVCVDDILEWKVVA